MYRLPWFEAHRVLQRKYGDAWTVVVRLGRWVLELNIERKRRGA